MENGEVTFEQGDDPNGCKNETSFNDLSRDFERTPYHWDTSKNAGFSDADKTWLPVSAKYLETNLAAENIEDAESHYHIYQDLLKLRQQEPFKSGKTKIVAVSHNVLAYSASLQDFDPYVVILNLGDSSSEFVNVTNIFKFNTERIEVILSSVNSSFSKGSLYPADNFEIKPHEGVVARVVQKGNNDWWKHGVFYQIYLRSFKDSNSDGIGDIKGITNKIKHFVYTDYYIDAICLSSFYKSAKFDAGITDFKSIDEDYGTMEDFEELLEKAHELGIKVIIEFIPNHSSNEHEWFTLSKNKTSGYEDYYVWKDGVEGEAPNNWVKNFRSTYFCKA